MALFSHQGNKWSEVFVLAQVFIRSLGISDRVPGSILLSVKTNVILNPSQTLARFWDQSQT